MPVLVIFFVLAVIVLIWFGNLLIDYWYHVPDDYDEHRTISAGDNLEIDLWRYSPEDPGDKPPVLLVHGLTANHRNLAFNSDYGFAQYLKEKGYDCWAIDLRGRNKILASGESWCFDEYLNHDLPEAVNYILAETDHDQLHWVGHSMGGMLLLAFAGTRPERSALASGVTIGSPVILDEPKPFRLIASAVKSLPAPIYKILRPFIHFSFAGLIYLLPWRVWFLIMVGRNFSREVLELVSNSIVSRVNYRVPLQFLRWLATGTWCSDDGSVNYRERLTEIDTPIYTLVGIRDELCPDRKTAGYDRLGTTDKKFTKAAKENGYQYDYNHISLVFSSGARKELFPEIKDWLQEHS